MRVGCAHLIRLRSRDLDIDQLALIHTGTPLRCLALSLHVANDLGPERERPALQRLGLVYRTAILF